MAHYLWFKEKIDCLLKDLDDFAKTASAVDLEMYEARRFDFYDYPLGLYLLCVKKAQVKSLEEAFTVLFIKDLHYQNDWIYSEAARINSDQHVIDKLSPVDLAIILSTQGIVNYLGLAYRYLNIQAVPVNTFQEKFLWWLPDNVSKIELDDMMKIIEQTKWVCSLFPDDFYDKFFGETDAYYFFAESGVYD